MAAASRDLQGLLAGLDPTADVAQRHIWLINIFDWLRGDRASPQAAMGRVQLLLDAIEARPELRERLRALDADNAHRRHVAQAYLAGLAEVPCLALPAADDADRQSAWHLFVVRHHQRDALAEQLAARGMREERSAADGGPATQLGIPIKFAREPGRTTFDLPALGQHTSEVMREAGWTPEQIAALLPLP
eukprot:gene28218-37223_t